MTGRAAGPCAGYGMPGYAEGWPGRGPGRRGGYGRGEGFGRGRGCGGGGWASRWWRHAHSGAGTPGRGWWGVAPAPEVEQEWLASQAEALEGDLKAVRARLAELEQESARKS